MSFSKKRPVLDSMILFFKALQGIVYTSLLYVRVYNIMQQMDICIAILFSFIRLSVKINIKLYISVNIALLKQWIELK